DLFLETKDVLTEQVSAYRNEQEPDQGAYERICAQLRELALEKMGGAAVAATPVPAAVSQASAVPSPAPVSAPEAQSDAANLPLCVGLSRLNPKDIDALAAEMALLGDIVHQQKTADSLTVWLSTTATAE